MVSSLISPSPAVVVFVFVPSSRRGVGVAAFTALEVVTAVFIVAILAVMALPVLGKLQQRARGAACATNLKNLYVGTDGYVQDHHGWPSIPAPDARQGHDDAYVTAWQAALQPYGITPLTWVCPELHRLRGRPDLAVPVNRSVDYLAATFDATKPRKPYEHANMPWFVETTDAHGGGQLIIFSNGSVMGMKEAIATFVGTAANQQN